MGANGFIGSRLTIYLAGRGYEVTAMVDGRYNYQLLKDIPNVRCIEFSLETLEQLNDENNYEGIDICYHLAWVGVNAKYRNDNESQLQNINYGVKVIDFCKAHKIKKLLIPGSAAEVSCGNSVITGHEIPSPSDMYSATKVAVHYICKTYAAQNGIDLVWTLITSIYGPGRDDNNLLSYAIKSLLKNEKPSFTGLEQKWDYLYIDDLMVALEALGNKGLGGKCYPVASGQYRQMKEYVEMIRNLINPNAVLGIGEVPYKNPDKIDNQVLDISELTVDTGFTPRMSFEEGIKKTIEYFKTIVK